MKVALIGNPNSGKTSLFNELTGSNQKIGNWPGVTIEKKEGRVFGTDISIVDLPGVYSLIPYTSEEIVSRDYLLNEKPDLVINIIDSTALERSLYLTTQLLDLNLNVVLALNMTDLLISRGIVLDENKLASELGVRAVKISAKKGIGIKELLNIISTNKVCSCKVKIYSAIIEKEINNVKKQFNLANYFEAIELLKTDKNDSENQYLKRAKQIIEKIYDSDIEEIFANEKYCFISKVRDKCLDLKDKKETTTDKLDRIFLHRILAIPIFVVIMSFVYILSVGIVGKFSTAFLNNFFASCGKWVDSFFYRQGVSVWIRSLVVDGIIAGISSVLSFVPSLIILFACISFLESTGYMSRIALIFDRVFRKFGLGGKSLIPFIVGTGCSVPAITTTKTIECKEEREMTIMLSPFVPCSAKLPIISLFAGFFFSEKSGLVTASFYFLSIAIIVFSAILLKKFVYKNQTTSFISELPEYKLPSLKYVTKDVFDKTKNFIVRVGTVIVVCCITVWFLSSFGLNFKFCNDIQDSILAKIGNLFGWFFYPIIGEWNWAVSISAIQGLIAKEQVVSSMSVIAGLDASNGVVSIFSSGIFSCFSKVTAYAFVAFNLFSAPCVSAIAAMKGEFKSTRKTIFAVVFQILIAWIISCAISLVGGLVL